MSSQIQPPLPRRSPSGFTLVELLVVIGIIALLISILLPSLGKARRAAIAIKCQSNLHQIGLGLAQYAAFNKGSLPYGYYCGTKSTAGNNSPYYGAQASDWTTLLAAQQNGRIYSPNYADVTASYAANAQVGTGNAGGRGMFICPAVDQTVSKASILTDYTCSPRLMPTVGQQCGDPQDNGGVAWNSNPLKYFVPWKLAAIKRSQEIAVIFDAPVAFNGPSGQTVTAGSWSASTVAWALDAQRQWSDTFLTTNYAEAGGGKPWLTGDASVDLTPPTGSADTNPDWNADRPGNLGQIRFRHGGGQIWTCNVLYCDGHVAPSQLTANGGQHNAWKCDLKRRNIYVDWAPMTTIGSYSNGSYTY